MPKRFDSREPTPAVSVTMPAYNAERYIGEAIDSLRAQTFQDWELIVVDDGSTDSTPEILAALDDPRIRVFAQENGGEARARNATLRHARGEYLAFLDSDDVFLPDALADRVGWLREHPDFGAVVADGRYCDSAGAELQTVSSTRRTDCTGWILEPLILDSSVVGGPSSVTLRRSALVEHSLEFDPGYRCGTDWDMWVRLARFVQFGYLPTDTFRYRVHGSNMTTVQDDAGHRRDWVFGRMKVLNSPWFAELSETLRFEMVQMMLLKTPEDLDFQRRLLDSPQAKALPAERQARLWSNAASTQLRSGGDEKFASEALDRAWGLAPGGWRQRALRGALALGGPWARGAAKAWQLAVNARRRLDPKSRRAPETAAAELLGGGAS